MTRAALTRGLVYTTWFFQYLRIADKDTCLNLKPKNRSNRKSRDELRLARIIYHLLTTREPYHESVFQRCEEETLRRMEARLRKQAANLGSS